MYGINISYISKRYKGFAIDIGISFFDTVEFKNAATNSPVSEPVHPVSIPNFQDLVSRFSVYDSSSPVLEFATDMKTIIIEELNRILMVISLYFSHSFSISNIESNYDNPQITIYS